MTDAMKNRQNEEKIQCECGEATGVRCVWSGPKSETRMVEWMPEYLRASHAAAGNSGRYPFNGALRLRCQIECANMLESETEEES